MNDKILVRGGYVLSMSANDRNDGRHDVLIENGRIAAIGSCLPQDDATVIEAKGSVVLPGLIDSHRHLWYTALRAESMDHGMGDIGKGLWPKVGANISPEDMYSATRAGIVEALNMGITTILDYCHAINSDAHADRAIDAHLELPGRALFAYGPSIAQKMTELSGGTPSTNWSHARKIQERVRSSRRTSFALAPQGPGRIRKERISSTTSRPHAAWAYRSPPISRPWRGGAPNDEVKCMCEWGLLGPDMHFSHCVACSNNDFVKLREHGVQVTVSPMAEQFLGMGTPPLARMHRAGLRPAVGADAVIASSGDLFEEARAGLIAARSAATREVIDGGSAVTTLQEMGMTTMDALASITSRASAAVFMSDSIGTLEIGKKADVIVVSVRGFDPGSAEEAAGLIMGSAAASDVKTVIVDGVVVKDRGQMVGIDTQSILDELATTRRKMKAYYS